MKEKNNIWRFISLFISLNFLIINLLIHYIKRKKNIYIFDIDNTICDTWKSLPRKKTKNFRYIRNEIKRISLLKIFTKMKEFILPYNEVIHDTQNVIDESKNDYEI